MTHTITRLQGKIEIQMTGMGSESEAFVKAFGNPCSEDNKCSPKRYRTLHSIDAEPIHDGVRIELKSHGEPDMDEVDACLDNTITRILAQTEKAEEA